MVFLIEKWKDFKESLQYAKFILYQIRERGEYTEIVIKAGKLAYIGTYRKDDPELKEILSFLENRGIKVKDAIPEENIFLEVIA